MQCLSTMPIICGGRKCFWECYKGWKIKYKNAEFYGPNYFSENRTVTPFFFLSVLKSLLAKQPATPTRGATVSVITTTTFLIYFLIIFFSIATFSWHACWMTIISSIGAMINFNCLTTPLFVFRLCFRNLLDGLLLALLDPLAVQAVPMWPASHQWPRSRNLTPTWRVSWTTGTYCPPFICVFTEHHWNCCMRTGSHLGNTSFGCWKWVTAV